MITDSDYFKGHPELRTPELEARADGLLLPVNALRAEAQAGGVVFHINPHTGTYISGNGNGGIRPTDSTVGAVDSNHKRGRALDQTDPTRLFASWCMAHVDRLRDHGIYMEDPRWTVTIEDGIVVSAWVHWQDVPPRSGKIIYIPSESPPLADWPPTWA